MAEDKISHYDIGTRVVVSLNHPQEAIVYLLGYGIYVSDEIPDESAVGQLADHCRKMGKLNPKIVLDDGRHVYGSEVFWGDAAQLETLFASRQIVHCDLDDERQKARDLNTPLFGSQEPDMASILLAAKEKASKLHG
tara:strand:- start:2826 stop:3236 length:411 start_codon:yes stop_codon:yes gene_type:complete